jgi:hypothetical protein
MPLPTVAQAIEFFQSDRLLSEMPADRIQYWITDISDKGLVTEMVFGKFYFNGFLNLLGHFMLVYETQVVSYRGGVTAESTSQVSRSFKTYTGTNPAEEELYLTKYGQIFSSIVSRLAFCKGGFVSGGCGYV